MRRARAVFLVALLAVAGLQSADGASRVLPRLAFRVLRTPHFRVYYHQGLEPQARLLANIAESVWSEVPVRLGLPAPAVTHVLLVDQDDAANGWATPLPYDTVMVTAGWPAPSEIIGNTSDWLRLVFTHEFTHVLQLHQSRGYARAVKWVFGRAPFAFPNLFLPGWSTEGISTYAESRFTGEGRLKGGDSWTLVAGRVREAGPERMDRLTGGQVEWPAGVGPYLYGGFFAEYLAARFGEEKLGELGRRTAGRLPYFASGAYRHVFGQGLGELWADYQRTFAVDGTGDSDRPSHVPPVTPRQLTHEGHYVSTPRFTPGAQAIVYGRRNPNDFPAVAVLPMGSPAEGAAASPASSSRARGRRLAIRYGGEQLSVSGRTVFFDRADYETSVAWRSDLFAADIETGRVQRLTRGARLVAPDVSPDGRRLACIEFAEGGERRLRFYSVEGGEVGRLSVSPSGDAIGAPGETYGSPRWSPDGSRLAVERRQRNGPSEIVVYDVAARQPRVIVAGGAGRNVTPSWLPDGRTVVFSSDRDGRSFQLYTANALAMDGVRPALGVPGGAMAAEVAPDGRRVVYVGYTAAGYDLFEAPFAPVVPAADDVASEQVDAPAGPAIGGSDRQAADTPEQAPRSLPSSPYRPFFTLLPRSWQPAGDYSSDLLRLGFSTGSVDLLGRHAFGATILWRLQGGSDAMYGPQRARPDWSAFYVYDRWRPAFFAAASDETSFLPQAVEGIPQADAELRERQVSFGANVPFAGVRRSQVVQAAFNLEQNTLRTVRGDGVFARNAIQAGWAFSSARQFGYSISPEHGIVAAVTSEQVREAFGADGSADGFSGELRAYARVGPGHAVLAARAALGVSEGDASVARRFYLGGPQAGGVIDFGSDALSLLRGFDDREFVGTHLGAANVEYRFPAWRIERGEGNWPFFLRTVHGAVFADLGQVWDGAFTWQDYKASIGAEVSLDVVLGFSAPLTFAGGVATTFLDGRPAGTAGYVRLGRSF